MKNVFFLCLVYLSCKFHRCYFLTLVSNMQTQQVKTMIEAPTDKIKPLALLYAKCGSGLYNLMVCHCVQISCEVLFSINDKAFVFFRQIT